MRFQYALPGGIAELIQVGELAFTVTALDDSDDDAGGSRISSPGAQSWT